MRNEKRNVSDPFGTALWHCFGTEKRNVSDPFNPLTGDNSYRFGAGVDAASVTLKVGSLRLEFGDGEGGDVHLMNVDHNDLYTSLGGTQFEFADGSVLSSSELLARGLDIEGSAANDITPRLDTATGRLVLAQSRLKSRRWRDGEQCASTQSQFIERRAA